jgi:hypothetical protein
MNVAKTSLLLDKLSKKEKVEQSKDNSSSDTLLLLADNSKSKEVEILKAIGLDHHIREVEKVKNDSTRIQIIENTYNRPVYTGEQIKKLCNQYGLRILRADSFKAKTPTFVGEEILKFVAENTQEVVANEETGRTRTVSDLYIGESSFFILSTNRSFNGKSLESATLFYREKREDQHYYNAKEKDIFVEVCSWGKSFDNSLDNIIDFTLCDDDRGSWIVIPMLFCLISLIVSLFIDQNMNYLFLTGFILSTIVMLLSDSSKYFKSWTSN